MLNIYLTIAIVLTNLIAISIVYQFIKKLDKKQILLFVGISVGIMYILVSLVYWLSGFGVEKELHEASKNFIVYLFVPVNVIITIPYFADKYMKLKTNQIKRDKFANKLTILFVVLIITLIIEFIVFKNIQNNIKDILVNTVNENLKNEIVDNEQHEEKLKNSIVENEQYEEDIRNDVEENEQYEGNTINENEEIVDYEID